MDGNGAARDPSGDPRRERAERSDRIATAHARENGQRLHRAVVNALAAARQTR